VSQLPFDEDAGQDGLEPGDALGRDLGPDDPELRVLVDVGRATSGSTRTETITRARSGVSARPRRTPTVTLRKRSSVSRATTPAASSKTISMTAPREL
jgi:hypothetical protein